MSSITQHNIALKRCLFCIPITLLTKPNPLNRTNELRMKGAICIWKIGLPVASTMNQWFSLLSYQTSKLHSSTTTK